MEQEVYIDDIMHLYLDDIKDNYVLSDEQEVELFKRLESGDNTVINILVEHNLKLVVHIAKEFKNRGVEMLDLIQEGNLALYKAIDMYDYKLGYRFSTYAINWIKLYMRRYIDNKGRIIRIPIPTLDKIRKLKKVKSQLTVELGREPNIKELIDKTGFSEDKIIELDVLSAEILSLDTPIKNEDNSDDMTLIDIVTSSLSSEEYCVEKETFDNVRHAELLKIMTDKLNDKEMYVLKRRFGLEHYDEGATLEEIGDELGVTKEWIRQIQDKALTKLRDRKSLSILHDLL